jgi:hypothetical protein
MADPVIRFTATNSVTAVANQVRASLEGVDRKVGALSRSFGSGLAASVAAAFAPVAIGAFIQRVAGGVDALNDLKDATGASIENISALEDVAARTGTEFDTVATSLVRFNKVLAEASPGSDMAQLLKSIGLNAKELREIDPAEALRRTAVALSGYADDQKRAQLIAALFNKTAREAAPFLNDLAEQGKLVATVTTEQAREAEKFNKQLAALSKNSTDVSRAFLSDLLPVFNTYLEKLERARQVGFKGFAQEVNSEVQSVRLGVLVSQIEEFDEALRRNPGNEVYRRRLRELREEYETLSRQAAAANERLKAMLPAPPEVRDAGAGRGFIIPDLVRPSVPDLPDPPRGKQAEQINEAQRALAGYVATLERELESTREVSEETKALALLRSLGKTGEIAQVRELVLGRAAEIDQLRETIAQTKLKADADAEIARRQAEAQSKLNALLAQTPTGQGEAIAQDTELVTQAFERGAISAAQYAELLAEVARRYSALAKPVDELTKRISTFADQASRNIQSALGDTLEQTLAGNFKSIGRLWADLMRRMVAEALSAKLLESLFGKGAGSGGSGDPISAWFGRVLGQAGTPSLDRGTDYVPRDMLAMIHKGERIVPADQNRAGSWSGGRAVPAIGTYSPTFHIGQGVSMAQVQAAVALGNNALETKILRSRSRAGPHSD